MTKQKVVVVVEDEPDTADLFAEMIGVMGHQVVITYSGLRAIAVITDKKPAAVILDLMMPDTSGLDVLRYMRRDPRLVQIPVIVVSARCMPSDIKESMAAGATSYLTKPVSYIDLKEAVENVFRS